MGRDLPEEFKSLKFRIAISEKGKQIEADVDYPKGKIKKDDIFGNYAIYRGKVVVHAITQRGMKSDGPMQVEVFMQGSGLPF